jgi:SAM-dependent methyltransferase
MFLYFSILFVCFLLVINSSVAFVLLDSYLNKIRLHFGKFFLGNEMLNNTEKIDSFTTSIDKKKQLYAASKNKEPILEVLKPRVLSVLNEKMKNNYERDCSSLNMIEIASGTGEHCAYFNENISDPSISYLCTEPDTTMSESIEAWIEATQPKTKNNLLLPVVPLDINKWQDFQSILPFPSESVDIMICINMIHISPWSSTLNLFQFASSYLRRTLPSDSTSASAFLLTYGPYSVNHGEMVESNQRFSQSLKERNPEWGVRDVEDLKVVAFQNNMELVEMVPMPSNNYCLVWKRKVL